MNLPASRSNLRWINLSYWLTWLALWASLFYTAASYGSGHFDREIVTNSDSAFIPVFFRDVLARGTISGWELPTNPSFFPDMLLFILVDLIVPNINVAFLIYGLAQLMLVFLGMIWVQRTLFAGNRWAEMAMLLTLTVCMLFIATGKHLFQIYALMSVHHVGVLVVIPYVTVFVLKAWQPEATVAQQRQSIWILLLLSFLTSLSDTLFIIQFVLPTLVASWLWARGSQLDWRRILWLNVGLLLATAAGQALRQMLVPIRKLLTYVKGWDNQAIALAYGDFRHQSAEVAMTDPLLAAFWLLSLAALIAVVVICLWRMKGSYRHEERALSLVAGIFLGSVVIGAIIAILSGNSFTTRYIFSTIYLPLLAGLPFLLALWLPKSLPAPASQQVASQQIATPSLRTLRTWPLLNGTTTLVALLLLGYMLRTTQPSAFASLIAYQDPVVACLEREAAQRQIRNGVAGYWQTTNINALAEGRLHITSVFPNLFPFVGNGNRRTFQEPFDFVMIRQDAPTLWRIQEQTLQEKFGPSTANFICESSKIYLYDYAANPQVHNWFAHHPGLAELEEVGGSAEFYGYTLLSQIDAVTVGLSQGAGEQWDQDEGILAYAPLKALPAGVYAVALDLYADSTDSGAWEAVATTPTSRTFLNGAPITTTGNGVMTGTFTLTAQSDVDVVIRYNGHDSLFLDRMSIAHIDPTQAATFAFDTLPTSPVSTVPTEPGTLRLVYPPSASQLATREVDFVWQWTGSPLPKAQTFEVRLWPQAENIHYGAHDAKATAGEIRQIGDTYILHLNLSGAYSVIEHGAGDYAWSVGLVAVEPAYQDLQLEAPPALLSLRP